MGGDLFVTARSEERLVHTVDQMGTGKAIYCNLLSNEDLDSLVDVLPELDGIVLCAGMNKKEPVNFIADESLNVILDTNFTSNVKLIKRLLRKKKISKGASVVIISSISVDSPAVGNSIYAASKGAVSSYSKVLALELSKKGIRVNTIEPGMVHTEWLDKSTMTAELFTKDETRYPLGRYGLPEDIANAAIYLLSDASSWMTGSKIRIDGGISLL